jgi:hypothetical protein
MNVSEWFSYQLKASGEGFVWVWRCSGKMISEKNRNNEAY